MIIINDYPSESRPSLTDAKNQWAEHEFCLTAAARSGGRALLHGPKGTMKSSAASTFGLNGPLYRMSFTREMSAAKLLGHWLVHGGNSIWMDGPGLASWRVENSRFVGDEIDEISGDCYPVFNGLSDDPEMASITLMDGSVVRPAKGFTCFCTMNSDPKALPEPLRDRFVVTLHVTLPRLELLERLPEKIRPFCALAVFKKVPLPPSLAKLESTRTWVDISEKMTKLGFGFADALRSVAIPNAMKAIDEAFGKTNGVEDAAL